MRNLRPKEVKNLLGISHMTLLKYEESGLLTPVRTAGGHRRYPNEQVRKLQGVPDRPKIGYARVSSRYQEDDLKTQIKVLELYCDRVIRDTGSGLNFKKPGLSELLRLIDENALSALYLTTKDRLLRFGSDLIFQLCRSRKIEVVILHNPILTLEQELARDVLTLITVFSARLNGMKSHQNSRLLK